MHYLPDNDNESSDSEISPRKRKHAFHVQVFIIKSYRKETQEKDGKVIVLKEVDTDVEQNQQGRNRFRFLTSRRFGGNCRYQHRKVSQNNADKQQGGENNGQSDQKHMPER